MLYSSLFSKVHFHCSKNDRWKFLKLSNILFNFSGCGRIVVLETNTYTNFKNYIVKIYHNNLHYNKMIQKLIRYIYLWIYWLYKLYLTQLYGALSLLNFNVNSCLAILANKHVFTIM